MKFLNKIMITCIKATELIEKRQIQSLSFGEWFRLKLHVALCEACEAYKQQSKTIERAINLWFNKADQRSPQLSQEKKNKIIDKIKKL